MFTWLFVLRIRPNSFYLNIFRFFDRKMSWNSIFLKLSLLFTVNIGIYKSISPCLKTKLFYVWSFVIGCQAIVLLILVPKKITKLTNNVVVTPKNCHTLQILLLEVVKQKLIFGVRWKSNDLVKFHFKVIRFYF